MIKEGEKQMSEDGERAGMERCRMRTSLQQVKPAQRELLPAWVSGEHKTIRKVMTYE